MLGMNLLVSVEARFVKCMTNSCVVSRFSGVTVGLSAASLTNPPLTWPA